MDQSKVNILQDFTQDPNWAVMESFIKEHFETSTDVNDIDASGSPETVQQEVFARQEVSKQVQTLLDSFNQLRQTSEAKNVSFK